MSAEATVDAILTGEIPKIKGASLLPVTTDRIASQLTNHGYQFQTDEDGDLTGIWDDNQFWFILGGDDQEILQVRGRWSQTVPSSDRNSVLLAVNDWNRDHLWPKVYCRDEGDLVLYAEVSVDFECGATDAQLQDALACGLVTTSQFFKNVSILTEPDLD
jgi:hypothetical protein